MLVTAAPVGVRGGEGGRERDAGARAAGGGADRVRGGQRLGEREARARLALVAHGGAARLRGRERGGDADAGAVGAGGADRGDRDRLAVRSCSVSPTARLVTDATLEVRRARGRGRRDSVVAVPAVPIAVTVTSSFVDHGLLADHEAGDAADLERWCRPRRPARTRVVAAPAAVPTPATLRASPSTLIVSPGLSPADRRQLDVRVRRARRARPASCSMARA